MKKKIAIILTIIMMFVMISGCSTKRSSSSNKKVKVLFSVSDVSDNYRKLLATSAKNYADSQNVELNIMDAAGSIETQVSHMKEAVSGGYDAIICAPVNPATALQLKRAAEGLPIVFMNSSPDDSLLEKDKYIYVASDEKVAGQYQAEYIANYLKNKNDLKVVLLKGEKGHSATKGRTIAVKDTLKEKGINAQYVFEDNANWSRQEAKDMFNVFLSTGQKFDCVIANNDEMALGVIDSFKENNIDPSSVPIVGIDATPEGCKAVVDGSMKLTVYQSAKGQSKSSVDAAIQLGSGRTLSNIENLAEDGKHIWVPFEKVSKENVNKYMS
ncbi:MULTISPECIES: substrate-binding domain-containing protein [unclassified Clostridium]|uniref:substrate-binding domain-containing protein n=1 Tax=unclassified Clostridium TaxID=2614128 RepID=UPI000297B421|nr:MULTISPECIES: substrate-binding domain-containing protein [unclassified Clostridium]EKQ57511.1 MAG: ABC-type sugar transport system, periplasmic component [Clostridium sp. Maddingley MBC34-26]